jgi:hypothetical protein
VSVAPFFLSDEDASILVKYPVQDGPTVSATRATSMNAVTRIPPIATGPVIR